MKRKFLLLLFSLCICLLAKAEEKYHINVLNEISYEQAQRYERKWEISTFTHEDYNRGVTRTRYFLFAKGIKHNSEIVITASKKAGCPWLVSINGSTYYASFNDDENLKVGDKGVLKYNGDRLYFYKE